MTNGTVDAHTIVDGIGAHWGCWTRLFRRNWVVEDTEGFSGRKEFPERGLHLWNDPEDRVHWV